MDDKNLTSTPLYNLEIVDDYTNSMEINDEIVGVPIKVGLSPLNNLEIDDDYTNSMEINDEFAGIPTRGEAVHHNRTTIEIFGDRTNSMEFDDDYHRQAHVKMVGHLGGQVTRGHNKWLSSQFRTVPSKCWDVFADIVDGVRCIVNGDVHVPNVVLINVTAANSIIDGVSVVYADVIVMKNLSTTATLETSTLSPSLTPNITT
ncbi:hypothetical protein FF38_07297 [Lucilia cuprina]|uniref:Uncharacterized protein n=1 Tax=Lucilia cuprina TaxID=7375 RepID=A0A0L0BQN8_LUCCU|nr:hypothetical protein FF38_07297 [Lucilia cuprina]